MEMPTPPVARGTVFAGRYAIIEELGRGGMGTVFRVEDRKVGEDVALKILDPKVSSDEKCLERFGQELKIARRISHRSVCRMHDLGESDGTHFITMEYVPGEDLKSLIRRIGQLPLAKALALARQATEGLIEAHRLGVVHRDLKPGNIMIDREGNARIMDFGIARSVASAALTGAGLVVGTPDYMPPEQAEGEPVDGRADIYSLGVILYEMVTGCLPFEGKTPLSVALKHKNEKPRDPKDLNPQLPPALSRLILKCLEKDREKRYQTAEELREEIVSVEKSLPTGEWEKTGKRAPTRKEITVTVKVRKIVIPAAAAAVVAVAAFVLGPAVFKAKAAERSVAVIPFQNQTGDPSFDYLKAAISDLLITSLEQSESLQVTTSERMRDVLRQTGRDAGEAVDSELGFELCGKDGVDALVVGSFIKAGETFATDVKVYDVRTRRLLKSATAQGAGAQSILDRQIGQLSREISRGIGLAAPDAGAGGKGPAVQTTSLEAYKHFHEGLESLDRLYLGPARASFEKAVELDPQFAIAWLCLFRVHTRARSGDEALAALEKAKAHAGRATEKERLYIEAAYAGAVEKDDDKEVRLLRRIVADFPKEKEARLMLLQRFREKKMFPEASAEAKDILALDPDWFVSLNDIGYLYMEIGDLAKAGAVFIKAVSLAPGDANPRDSLGEYNFRAGRLDEAISRYKEAIRIRPDFGSQDFIAYVYAVEGDFPNALGWLDQFILTTPPKTWRTLGYWWKAIYNHVLGKRSQAAEEMAMVESSFAANADRDLATQALLFRAHFALSRGDCDEALGLFSAYRETVKRDRVLPDDIIEIENELWPGFVEWKQGRLEEARARIRTLRGLLAKPDRRAGELIPQLEKAVAILEAEVLLAEGKAAEAAAVLEGGRFLRIPFTYIATYPRAFALYNLPLDQDVLARARLKLGDLDLAAVEYRKLIELDPAGPDRRIRNPIYRCRLAGIYERQGLKAQARDEYRKFLEEWKEADPGLPELIEAKKRFARL